MAATCAAFVFVLLVWEWIMGGAGFSRAAGYAAAFLLATGSMIVARRRWLGPTAEEHEVALRLERLFPQARGRVMASLEPELAGLAGARTSEGRAWLARSGEARLERAFCEQARSRARRTRRTALALAAIALLTALVEPAAGRRMIRAVLDPETLWRTGSTTWRVTPGDVEVEYGASVAGAARYDGPAVDGSLVLEWREGADAWRAETLGQSAYGDWTWEAVAVELRYRLRLGRTLSPEYRLAVRPPLTLVRVEGRGPGEAWAPLAGRTVAADENLEIRGGASGPLAAAVVVDAGDREVVLDVAGVSFRGPVRGLAVGEARVSARGEAGHWLDGAVFFVAARASAYVEVLRPAEDPTTLTAESAWIEVRAGAPAGLATLTWETADGREGSVVDVVGARDTVVTAVVPLAAGRMPGDTVRYRVVARPASGSGAVTPWRTAVVASAAFLRTVAEEERAAARQAIAAALEAARRASEERGETMSAQAEVESAELDRRLTRAADSLARALDRTLADPDLDAELAAQLEGYRRQLEGVAAADFDPPRGAPPNPAAAAEARAAVLEAIAERLAEIERSIQRAAAADSLERLADAQSELAAETREVGPEELERSVAARQRELSDAARAAARRLSEAARSGLEEALSETTREIEAGDPSAAASAQERAAEEMMQSAGQTRAEEGPTGIQRASNRAALDRAGAESLFLAERQRVLAEREGRLDDAGERATRLARQRVVTGGLERALGTMVEAIGGRPAGMDLAMRIAQAVYSTRVAEAAVEQSAVGPGGAATVRSAAEDAATALALLARGLFLPDGAGGGMGGVGQVGESGPLSQQLQRMAGAQTAMADALASSEEPAGGNAEAAAAERRAAGEVRAMGEALEEQGLDARSVEALARAIEAASTRLERGLSGAQTESELRSLARRLADLGRMVDRQTSEQRRSETARLFVPANPPPLEGRITAPILDPESALAPWAGSLPAEMLGVARRYLEALAEEGVRAREGQR